MREIKAFLIEQVWLHISLNKAERNELTEYQELSSNVILSELACMTPFSQMNAGARNIYQCQMAKQTFGVPSHTLSYRSDNKMYRLQEHLDLQNFFVITFEKKN